MCWEIKEHHLRIEVLQLHTCVCVCQWNFMMFQIKAQYSCSNTCCLISQQMHFDFPTHGKPTYIVVENYFLLLSRNISIVRYRISLVTILFLDLVMIHWIRWIQRKLFREHPIVEFVLGRFSHFYIAIAYSVAPELQVWKLSKFSAKGAHPRKFWHKFIPILCEILASSFFSNRKMLKFNKEITKLKCSNM